MYSVKGMIIFSSGGGENFATSSPETNLPLYVCVRKWPNTKTFFYRMDILMVSFKNKSNALWMISITMFLKVLMKVKKRLKKHISSWSPVLENLRWFSCQCDTDKFYFGETDRHIGIRGGVHLDLEKTQVSAVRTYIQNCEGCFEKIRRDLLSYNDFENSKTMSIKVWHWNSWSAFNLKISSFYEHSTLQQRYFCYFKTVLVVYTYLAQEIPWL